MKKQESGFTLIELVVVIVILGILAAVAVPKFIDLSSDARGGVMKGVEAAMRGADTMIYAKSAAAGTANSATGSVTTNGATVATVYGYSKDAVELAKVLTLSPAGDFVVSTGNIEHAKAKTVGVKCAVIYTPATSTTTPGYATVTDDC